MLNESLITLPLSKLKDILYYDLSISHLALTYILMYVIYKALGRFIYFKPQEHASKVNRTFLTLSLLLVILHTFKVILFSLPFLPEYRWIYALSLLFIFIIPLSILMEKIVWKKDKNGSKIRRNWTYYYLPVNQDYYKTTVSKSESNGDVTSSWEEEGVESTQENMHSDALLNVLALGVFITTSALWAYKSVEVYGYRPFIFFIVITLPVASVFFDRAIFSWIDYLEEKRNY